MVACLLAARDDGVPDVFDLLPVTFSIHEVRPRLAAARRSGDVLVAFAAGIAGMLAVETRASMGVGVAISVTTIPAAAFLGVAAGSANSRNRFLR